MRWEIIVETVISIVWLMGDKNDDYCYVAVGNRNVLVTGMTDLNLSNESSI